MEHDAPNSVTQLSAIIPSSVRQETSTNDDGGIEGAPYLLKTIKTDVSTQLTNGKIEAVKGPLDSTTNGLHHEDPQLNVTSNSGEPAMSTNLTSLAATEHKVTSPLTDSNPPIEALPPTLNNILDPVPAVVQQPISDVRDETPEKRNGHHDESSLHDAETGTIGPSPDLQPIPAASKQEEPSQSQTEILPAKPLESITPASLPMIPMPPSLPVAVPEVSELPVDQALTQPSERVKEAPEPDIQLAEVELAQAKEVSSAIGHDPEPMQPSVAENNEASAQSVHVEGVAHNLVPTADAVMVDVPSSPPKASRQREEDEEGTDGPAAKRTKTEEAPETSEFKLPEKPSTESVIDSAVNATSGTSAGKTGIPMTRPQQKHLQKAISNVKRIGAAKAFLAPVDYITLRIPSYPEIVKNPMDLKTLEENFKADRYATVDACLAEFDRIVENARLFNGPDHPVTLSAKSMKASFDKYMTDVPGPEAIQSAAPKKKAPETMSIRAPPARRESRSSLPGPARSPASAGSPQAFALGPDGIPLIRRDSTIDGRPKREIHRPAPKDLPYTHQKPKKKKFQWELKFSDHLLKELAKPKYAQYSFPFMQPVDPVALNIPTYLSVVKKPMDFGTVRQKLDRGEYENAKEFEVDARQVFKNCFAFNPEGDTINTLGHKFESIFNDEWNKKREWIDENTPSSGQRSPDSSEREDSSEEEEDDEEEEEEEDPQMDIVTKLQKQIAEMSKQVELITSGSKKNKTPPTTSKKSTKSSKGGKKETKKTAIPMPKTEKKATFKPTKKEKIPYVTYEQKQDISNRINSLTESKMTQALTIIRSNMPSLQGVHEDELELDIDELSNEVLYKLLMFVRKHAPRPEDEPIRAPTATSSSAAPPRKKNKPMSKSEQEARIAQVQSGLSAFQKGGAPASGVHQSIEQQDSDDDEEDSESEEE